MDGYLRGGMKANVRHGQTDPRVKDLLRQVATLCLSVSVMGGAWCCRSWEPHAGGWCLCAQGQHIWLQGGGLSCSTRGLQPSLLPVKAPSRDGEGCWLGCCGAGAVR